MIDFNNLVLSEQWKDPNKEKPKHNQLVLVHGREKYAKTCYGYTLAKYDAKNDRWSCDKPYEKGLCVKYWMRIPDIP